MTDYGDNQIALFFAGEGSDHRGRTIHDILAMDDFWLEHTHDYIQWLFPIPEAGRFNSFAPLLDQETQAFFAEHSELRKLQSRSFNRMLDFFGLVRNGTAIEAGSELNPRDHIWLKAGGHNHLRITRIIRSLHYCHQPELAEEFQSVVIALGQAEGNIQEATFQHWRSARG